MYKICYTVVLVFVISCYLCCFRFDIVLKFRRCVCLGLCFMFDFGIR